jgi:alpha-N-acetylglucosamine transferase
MDNLLKDLCSDCTVILERALLGKKVTAFGVDGHGEHGRSTFFSEFTIAEVAVLVTQGPTGSQAVAMIVLDGFDSAKVGHVSTDKNLTISLNKLFVDGYIDTTCWEYSDIEYQGQDFVMLTIDPELLIAF